MDWKAFFMTLFRNAIIAVLLGAIILGMIGFLLAGRQGFANGVTWGIVLGLISVPFMGYMIGAKYWGGVAGRYGTWRYKNELEGEDKADRHRR